MLFLMVETFSKDGIKIGFFPIEFIKKSFFEQCPKMEGRGVGGGSSAPRGGGCDLGGKLHFVRAHRRRNAPRAYTKGIEVPRYHVESRTP